MTTDKEFYPPDVEPVEHESEFFQELCGLIDRHADTRCERDRYLYALKEFEEAWSTTLLVSGATWGKLEPLEVKNGSE